MKLGIVVPVLNNFTGLTNMIKSIDHPFLPFIVDNYTKNRGVAAAWNLGAKNAIAKGCDYILICNDDIVFGPGTIAKLLEAGRSYFLDGKTVMVTAMNVREALKNGAKWETSYDPSAQPAESPDYSCFLIQPSYFELIGDFDEAIWPAYFEDNDSHYRIKLAGKQALCIPWAPMYHIGSATQNFSTRPVVTSQMFERNREYFVKKWGGTPGNEKFTVPFDGKTP